MRNVITAAVAVLLSCFALVSPAHAQDFDAAAKHFGAAQDAFGRKYFQTAAVEFQAAYDITKDPILLYNVGEAWEKAGDGKKAVASYKAYLKAQPNAQDKAEVLRRVKAIEGKKYKLASQSAPGDADAARKALAALSGPPPGVSPIPPQPPVEKPVPPPPPVAVTPPAPTPPPVVETPPPAPTPPPPAVVEPSKPPAAVELNRGPSKMRVTAWIGVAVTVATLTTGAILGLAAQSRADEISRRFIFVDSTGQPRTFDAQQQADYKSLKDEGELYNGLAIGFFSAAGAFAITTTVLFLVDWKQHKTEKATAFRLTPTFDRTGGGLAASWRF